MYQNESLVYANVGGGSAPGLWFQLSRLAPSPVERMTLFHVVIMAPFFPALCDI